jgi:hypothetical protein
MASSRLPLLEALETPSLAETSLVRQEAWVRIRNFLVHCVHRSKPRPRKRRRKVVLDRRRCVPAIQEDALFRSLRSPVTGERESAMRVLRSVSSPHSLCLLKQQLADLLQVHVLSRSSSRSSAQWTLEWTALWKTDLISYTTLKDWKMLATGLLKKSRADPESMLICVALADLLQVTVQDRWLWKMDESQKELSPLSCLLATYHSCLHQGKGQAAHSVLKRVLSRLLSVSPRDASSPTEKDGAAHDRHENEEEDCDVEMHDDDEDDDDDDDDDEEDEEIESMEEEDEHEELCAEDDGTVVRDSFVEVIEGDHVEMELEELVAEPVSPNTDPPDSTCSTTELVPSAAERKRLLIMASMQVLSNLYPHLHNQNGKLIRQECGLVLAAEKSLEEAMNRIIKPPKKPLNTKIILRRAPTQEEFFRGNLSRNPIPLNALGQAAAPTQGDSYEPTVADLRRHIAQDLQMGDSAELIEILVANKIVDVSLKLRVVTSQVWKTHLLESSGGTSVSTSILSASGLPILFSGLGERLGRNITADTPLAALPPMIATYRLAGVDGEATEDTVHTLVDPEAPEAFSTPQDLERLFEKEYGITGLVCSGRGIHILLRSIQFCLHDTLRRIRRDDVAAEGSNPSRKKFIESPPCPGLTLLRYCSQLPANRKLLLKARAPTILLTLLLDVLKALEEKSSKASGGNPTAESLQELIESLTSDISSTSVDDEEAYDSDAAQDGASMPLLLESLETISLSAPLRNVIAKLLPFLTYGQADLSKTLAEKFSDNISVEQLANIEYENPSQTYILMNTFVQTAISLPPTEVCNSLRSQLIHCGFIERLAQFIEADMPSQPPPWSPGLWPKGAKVGGSSLKKKKRKTLEESWSEYYARGGIRTALRILTGLCRNHAPTQARIARIDFVRACHWIESTSDNSAANINTDGLGLLAETLIDEIMEGNPEVTKTVEGIRKKTKQRKKELAEERRNKALHRIGAFGSSHSNDANAGQASTVRDAAASIFGPVFGLFRESSPSTADGSGQRSPSSRSATRASKAKEKGSPEKPAWLAEMEAMEDDVGLTCAVCQEGRTLQPSELLGLYAYVKKVSIPVDQGGSRTAIDGTELLQVLPSTMPDSIVGEPLLEEWYLLSRSAAESLPHKSDSPCSASKKNAIYTTTVSAGNAIHFSCHRTARTADRNHNKAPKSEWEGAILRNNRANCNVILPLVSSRSSKVPLIAVDSALTEHQGAVSNLLGGTPKSMLWTVLFDVRLLLLRIAYGESLQADSGGGSLSSNCQLIFYQLLMADMFDKDAQVDQPKQSQHARGLSPGFLVACASIFAKDDPNDDNTNLLVRGIADAAPMACLTSLVFHNSGNDSTDATQHPHPKRQWLLGKDHFLRGLLICSGRRHALGIEGSGCVTRAAAAAARSRGVSSFADWQEVIVDEDDDIVMSTRGSSRTRAATSSRRRNTAADKPTIEDFSNALRPMITLYAVMNVLSEEFSLQMDDVQVEECSGRLVSAIEECQRARNIHELLKKADVSFDQEEIIDLLQKGMVAA